jgi:hypothetical protein
MILEIAIDVLFFGTVAAIAVIFLYIREISLRKTFAASMTTRRGFTRILEEAAACVPTAHDMIRNDNGLPSTQVTEFTTGSIATTERESEEPVLSRAERELISSVTLERMSDHSRGN